MKKKRKIKTTVKGRTTQDFIKRLQRVTDEVYSKRENIDTSGPFLFMIEIAGAKQILLEQVWSALLGIKDKESLKKYIEVISEQAFEYCRRATFSDGDEEKKYNALDSILSEMVKKLEKLL